MIKRALFKDTLREIRKSLGRFFSIMVIVALGVAFLAGIKVSAPMMRDTTDQYMDQYHMMDISVLSTLGLEANDIEALSQLDEVQDIVGSYTINGLITIGGSQKVVKVHSLLNLSQEDEGFINKPKLIEGRWPSAPNECLIDGTKLTRLPLELGDTITLETGTDEAISDVLENIEYKVVGVIDSPYYMHFERGSAEIGNGSVSSYVYIPEQNFKSDIYTELFMTLKGTAVLDSYGEAYTNLVDAFKAKVEPIMEQRALARYEELIKNAKTELEEGQATFLEEKEKANKELADAAVQLEKAAQELTLREQELSAGELKAEEGFKEAGVAISQAESALIEKQKQYEEDLALFNAQKETIQKELDEAKNELTRSERQLQELKAALKSVEDQLVEAEGVEQELLLQQKQTLEAQITELTQVLQGKQQDYQQALAEFTIEKQTLAATQAILEQGRSEITKQKENLEAGKIATDQQFTEGKAQIKEAQATLKLEKEKYNTSKLEVQDKFKEAEAELAKGREKLEGLKEPKVYVLGREANYGVANYRNAVDTIDRIGQVFPIFFFVVAALVCLTTMTRMVDEQRTTIGTLKALGYSSFAIMSKYILYAGIASIVGSILGIIIGFKVFPNTIYGAYAMTFTVPPLEAKFYPVEAISAIIVMVVLTVFAAVFTAIKELKEQPSELMRPKAPAIGKRILLERIPFLWRRMNFFQKVVARNIFRYKKKFFMTTIGIAGCTALLLAGLGVKQSVTSIIDKQYGDIFKYDLEVAFKEGSGDILDGNTKVNDFLELRKQNIKAGYEEEQRDATLLIINDLDQLSDFIVLAERESKVPLNLQDDGVIISEKLAKALNIKVGDLIYLEDSDLEVYEVKVLGIAENYIGHYMYMTAAYAEKLTGKTSNVNYLLVNLQDPSEAQQEIISNDFTSNPNVISFSFITKQAGNFESMTASLDTVVIILIVSAALLVFVVLYNLTTINISERYREIATIKVLGFNDFKVSQYIYRENLMLTLIGSLMGLILGRGLFLFIIVTAEMDELMYGREMYVSNQIIAVILTFIFAMLVNLLMHFKLKKIEMVEALKSVE